LHEAHAGQGKARGLTPARNRRYQAGLSHRLQCHDAEAAMTDRKSPRSHHADGHSAENAVREGERIQATIDKKDKAKSTKPKAGPMQAGARDYPDEFPA